MEAASSRRARSSSCRLPAVATPAFHSRRPDARPSCACAIFFPPLIRDLHPIPRHLPLSYLGLPSHKEQRSPASSSLSSPGHPLTHVPKCGVTTAIGTLVAFAHLDASDPGPIGCCACPPFRTTSPLHLASWCPVRLSPRSFSPSTLPAWRSLHPQAPSRNPSCGRVSLALAAQFLARIHLRPWRSCVCVLITQSHPCPSPPTPSPPC